MTTNSTDRRGALLRSVGLAGTLAGLAAANSPAVAGPVDPATTSVKLGNARLRIVDLTHRLTRQFNFDPSSPRISMTSVEGSGAKAGMLMHRVELIEHTGTHIDVPSHFTPSGRDLGQIPLSDLVVPLAVIDLSRKASESRNAQLLPSDIHEWERKHGRLPKGCCVALHSGLDPIAEMQRNRSERSFSSTGFGLEAARMLLSDRVVKGIAVDAMTLDAGPNVPSYPVHQEWMRSGRWGIEGITNLRSVPASGAVLVVGAPPVDGATGFPIRALAIYSG